MTDFHGNALAPTAVYVQPIVADADGVWAATANPIVGVVSYDSTSVVVRGNVASQEFDLICIYEADNEDYPA